MKCVVCHVTGAGNSTGWSATQAQVALEHVGCEACHGPRARHIAEAGSREAIRRKVPDSLCGQCHNKDHSDFFNGQQLTYRERIRHWR